MQVPIADFWILYYILALVGAVIGFLISRHLDPMDEQTRNIVSTVTTRFLDEKSFKAADVGKEVNLSVEIVEDKLDFLARNGVLVKRKGGWFSIQDPLVFLVERDYKRAERITKNDNLLYGGYQEPFLSHKGFFAIYLLIGLILVFDALVLFLTPLRELIGRQIPPFNGEQNPTILPFLLFATLMIVVVVDVLENLVKAWGRERYSVIVGEASGVSYDIGYADEFSGRVPRGAIRQVFLDISPLQKLYNYFAATPRGDVKVKMGSKIIVFFNMPYPRELFYVIRSIQLKALGWRKKHARTLMMWKAQNVSQIT
ncbi:MAG: hypothetical protein ACFFBD_18650 [Candidatus Hodarchaeota archaeon]